MLACSFDTDLNYMTSIIQLCPSLNNGKMQQLFGCIIKDIQRFLLDPRPITEFSGKMGKFLRYLAEYLAVLAFLCCVIF